MLTTYSFQQIGDVNAAYWLLMLYSGVNCNSIYFACNFSFLKCIVSHWLDFRIKIRTTVKKNNNKTLPTAFLFVNLTKWQSTLQFALGPDITCVPF